MCCKVTQKMRHVCKENTFFSSKDTIRRKNRRQIFCFVVMKCTFEAECSRADSVLILLCGTGDGSRSYPWRSRSYVEYGNNKK